MSTALDRAASAAYYRRWHNDSGSLSWEQLPEHGKANWRAMVLPALEVMADEIRAEIERCTVPEDECPNCNEWAYSMNAVLDKFTGVTDESVPYVAVGNDEIAAATAGISDDALLAWAASRQITGKDGSPVDAKMLRALYAALNKGSS